MKDSNLSNLVKIGLQSFFRRMGFNKRAATTGKVIIPEGARKEAELLYHHDIVTKIKKHNILAELVFNLDQTPSQYVQCSGYTMEKEGKKIGVNRGFSRQTSDNSNLRNRSSGKFLANATNLRWKNKS